MPTPIITLPIHTIEQARALAGILRAYIDDQQPDTNDGADYKPDPDLAGMAALACHLDAGIKAVHVDDCVCQRCAELDGWGCEVHQAP
jgi:hypothetical protein